MGKRAARGRGTSYLMTGVVIACSPNASFEAAWCLTQSWTQPQLVLSLPWWARTLDDHAFPQLRTRHLELLAIYESLIRILRPGSPRQTRPGHRVCPPREPVGLRVLVSSKPTLGRTGVAPKATRYVGKCGSQVRIASHRWSKAPVHIGILRLVLRLVLAHAG